MLGTEDYPFYAIARGAVDEVLGEGWGEGDVHDAACALSDSIMRVRRTSMRPRSAEESVFPPEALESFGGYQMLPVGLLKGMTVSMKAVRGALLLPQGAHARLSWSLLCRGHVAGVLREGRTKRKRAVRVR